MRYSITLEQGTDGSCLAWVHELPGCFARAATREQALSDSVQAVERFRRWLRECGEAVDEQDVVVAVVDEVESVIEADEDTEVLLAPDTEPLSQADWGMLARWLSHSREDLLRALAALPDEKLNAKAAEGERTIRELVMHIAFVELMYSTWTFDLRSRAGLTEFLGWTRTVASERIDALAERGDSSLTYAEWAGAPRPEPWTARKAARRLIWHELLHAPQIGAPSG